MNNHKGYTLTEIMVVLFCWSVFLACIVPLHHHTYQSIQTKHTLKQFKEDVLLTQHLTMNDHIYYSLKFFQETPSYIIYDSKNKKTILNRKLPQEWGIQMLTLDQTIRFNQRGIIRKAGTMKISAPDQTFTVTFPFGASRLRIEKG